MQPIAMPDAPMALPTPRRPRQPRLREVVDAVAPALAAEILGAILGPPTGDGSWRTTIVGYFIAVEPGAASWRVIPPPNGPFSEGAGLFTPIGEYAHDATRRGHGLLGLLSALYGVPEGVAAVRLLEAVMGARMDADGALDVAAQIENWRSRGGRGRGLAAGSRWR